MAREPFLINPPKSRRRKSSRRRKAVTHKRKHRRSSAKTFRVTLNPRRRRKTNRIRRTHRRVHKRRRSYFGNPFGEEVLIMGANPRRRRRSGKRKHSRKTYRHRRNPVRYHKRRHSRRRHRRNPVDISYKRPMSLIAPIAVGLGARIALQKIPSMVAGATGLPTTGLMGYALKLAIVFGGQAAISKFAKRKDLGDVFAIVGLVSVGTEFIGQMVPTLGLSGYDYPEYQPLAPYGGFEGIGYDEGFSAYPDEM